MRDITYTVRRLVARHQGALPVILTSPHGGDEQPPGVAKERTGKGLPVECRFTLTTDRFTRTITRGVAQALFDVFGEAPYVVFANFDRKYIDANRSNDSARCAFEDPDAQEFYDEYHNTIRGFVDEIRADNGGLGLIFDIHGTDGAAGDQADIFLGTLNGDSISALLRRDPLAMSRARSLPGSLKAAGYVLSSRIPETLPGDFTLKAYGSSNPNGVDAVQIEIESELRTDETKRQAFIEDLAYAMSNLIARYGDSETLTVFRTASFLPRLRRG